MTRSGGGERGPRRDTAQEEQTRVTMERNLPIREDVT
jgi:hypothetical protein